MQYTIRIEGQLIVEGNTPEQAKANLEKLLQERAPWLHLAIGLDTPKPIALANPEIIDRINEIGEA